MGRNWELCGHFQKRFALNFSFYTIKFPMLVQKLSHSTIQALAAFTLSGTTQFHNEMSAASWWATEWPGMKITSALMTVTTLRDMQMWDWTPQTTRFSCFTSTGFITSVWLEGHQLDTELILRWQSWPAKMVRTLRRFPKGLLVRVHPFENCRILITVFSRTSQTH